MAIKQISVFIENKQGRLIAVTACLAEKNVNILALSAADTADYGILRLIVDQPRVALEALREAKFTVLETEVLGVATRDQPGGLNEALLVLEREGINVDYIYAFFGRGSLARNIFKVDDIPAAEAALTKAGLKLLTPDEACALAD